MLKNILHGKNFMKRTDNMIQSIVGIGDILGVLSAKLRDIAVS